jgi:hypothetical protein
MQVRVAERVQGLLDSNPNKGPMQMCASFRTGRFHARRPPNTYD